MREEDEPNAMKIVIICVVSLLVIVVLWLWIGPQYGIYSQRAAGQAQLAHAQASKEVAVAEAKAKMESATLLAEAEVIRARGVAQANQIIGNSLKGNESYLHYLWIIDVAANQNAKTVVYVPTEANFPILEAGKRDE